MAQLRAFVIGLMAILAVATGPARAGKSDDTLRIAVTDWWSTLDPYQFPLDEAAVFFRVVYESLVAYDERNHKFVPRLAKSWKQIDDKTIEFQLRDDVKFHNGDKFDADDVVGTIKYITDPATQLRFKDNYVWVDTVEKLGPYAVRITAKTAFATELETLAYRFNIYDSKVLAKLENKADYGRISPVATGPYKVVSLDQQKMVLVRFDDYYDKAGPWKAPIKNVIVRPIPDSQTKIAEFITGNIDVIRNASADTARELGKMPDTRVTPTHAGLLMYVTLDAMGRSDNKAMKDQRVRKAFMEAIDSAAPLASIMVRGLAAIGFQPNETQPLTIPSFSSARPSNMKSGGEARRPPSRTLSFSVARRGPVSRGSTDAEPNAIAPVLPPGKCHSCAGEPSARHSSMRAGDGPSHASPVSSRSGVNPIQP